MLDEYEVTCIYREYNGPADFMVDGESEGMVVEHVIGNLPPYLYNLIKCDGKGNGLEKYMCMNRIYH